MTFLQRTLFALTFFTAALGTAGASGFLVVTATGTISEGQNYGTFGPVTGSNAGKTFQISSSFNPDLSSSSGDDTYQDLFMATALTTITIGKYSYSFDSTDDWANYLSITAQNTGLACAKQQNLYELYAATGVTTDQQNIDSTTIDVVSGGMSGLDLTQSAKFQVAEESVALVGATAADGLWFSAEGPVNVTLNWSGDSSQSTVVQAQAPEPSTMLLAGGLLIALGVFRRKAA